MGTEIERKFVVGGNSWRTDAVKATSLRQGYLAEGEDVIVRVRTDGARAWLTLKGAAQGIVRPEFEYAIPEEDAADLLQLCGTRIISKTRHQVAVGRHLWEVDVFHGLNAGLVLAELELESPEEGFDRPRWLGPEVTGDPRYYNSCLAVTPFAKWAPPDATATTI